ncbi:hypothetical protein BDW66DRAFT_127473 [Aspergillus desertorum]
MPSQRLWGLGNCCQTLTLWMPENGLLPSATDGPDLFWYIVEKAHSDRFCSSPCRLHGKRPNGQTSRSHSLCRTSSHGWLLPILVGSSLVCPIWFEYRASAPARCTRCTLFPCAAGPSPSSYFEHQLCVRGRDIIIRSAALRAAMRYGPVAPYFGRFNVRPLEPGGAAVHQIEKSEVQITSWSRGGVC